MLLFNSRVYKRFYESKCLTGDKGIWIVKSVPGISLIVLYTEHFKEKQSGIFFQLH